MRKTLITAVVAGAFIFASSAAAALVPGVFDPGNTGCPVAKAKHGTLHLEKNCVSSTNAAAGADITGVNGQPFTTASFTLKSASQCQGGSPRFNVTTTDQTATRFLGCNNVTPTINPDGTATYNFTPASFVAAGQTIPTGTITSLSLIVDIQGTYDVTKVVVNGVPQNAAKGDKRHHGDFEHGDHGQHNGHHHDDHGHHGHGHDGDNDND